MRFIDEQAISAAEKKDLKKSVVVQSFLTSSRARFPVSRSAALSSGRESTRITLSVRFAVGPTASCAYHLSNGPLEV